MNYGIKPSEFLSDQRGYDLADAAQASYLLGYPLNVSITMHLDQAKLAVRSQKFITDFLHGVTSWLWESHKIRSHQIWVLENSDGLHVHIAVHFPATEFQREHRQKRLNLRVRNWFKSAGGTYSKNVFNADFMDFDSPNAGAIRYMLKGAKETFFDRWSTFNDRSFVTKHRFKSQGTVIGKRSGFSLTLNAAVRREASKLLQQLRVTYNGPFPHLILGWDNTLGQTASHSIPVANVRYRPRIPNVTKRPDVRADRC
jgi:hypothetical protein